MARIRVFTGHFGSGKTEIALNFAIQLAEQQKRVCLADLDIVNPYFCARDVKQDLEQNGIRLISAETSLSNAELSVVPPEINVVFNDKTYDVVMDIGGDDLGAVALGQFGRYFRAEPYDMYFVINKNRPLTSTKQAVLDYMNQIQSASRLRVTHLVSNTNMSFETTIDDVIAGDRFVAEIANELQLPHAFTVCKTDLVPKVIGRTTAPVLGVDIFMKPPWM